jgi:hypothetical protein
MTLIRSLGSICFEGPIPNYPSQRAKKEEEEAEKC